MRPKDVSTLACEAKRTTFDRTRSAFENQVNARFKCEQQRKALYSALVPHGFFCWFRTPVMQLLVVPPALVATPTDYCGSHPLPSGLGRVEETRPRRTQHPLVRMSEQEIHGSCVQVVLQHADALSGVHAEQDVPAAEFRSKRFQWCPKSVRVVHRTHQHQLCVGSEGVKDEVRIDRPVRAGQRSELHVHPVEQQRRIQVVGEFVVDRNHFVPTAPLDAVQKPRQGSPGVRAKSDIGRVGSDQAADLRADAVEAVEPAHEVERR